MQRKSKQKKKASKKNKKRSKKKQKGAKIKGNSKKEKASSTIPSLTCLRDEQKFTSGESINPAESKPSKA